MLERVVENWLTKANERSMEIPFCQLLAGEGYQVVHLSRHGPAEEGKDILAVSSNGVPCAFQLKGAPTGKMTLSAWAGHLPQITRLVEIPIIHPSIDPAKPRRVFLVTNGELEEEVRLEIAHRNSDWQQRGYPKLETVVKGQLLARFKALHTDLWPVELAFEKSLLELFLADGTDCLQKDKLAGFVLSLLPLSGDSLSRTECGRALANAAVMAAYALSPYADKENHVALLEGWTVYTACLIGLVTKYGLDKKCWQDALNISVFAIEQAFGGLCDELKTREHLIEGNALVDTPFYRGRVTWLVGLVSAFALWQRLRDPSWLIDDWFKTFVNVHQKDMLLWGEAAVPQFLATYWFLRQTTATMGPDALLASMIEGICCTNEMEQGIGLPDPYHGLPEVMEEQLGIAASPHREHFKGRAYTLESLVQLFAKRGWRQRLRFFWPRITRLHFAEFQPASPWKFCLWTAEHGELQVTQPKMPQSWAELREQAGQVDASRIPGLFQEHPELLLVFLLIYPHRLTKEVVKFLDDRLKEVKSRSWRRSNGLKN